MGIEMKELVHTYPSGSKALKGITTTIDGVDPVAIIGQNGSGKTTLVKHFNGILRPTGGDILIDGESIHSQSTAAWSKKVGYVFQNPDDQLFLDTVQKELEFGPKKINMSTDEIEKNVRIAAELCGLQDKMAAHPFDLTQTEKKFCTIASIIAMDPNVIVFDEPTMGQDLKGISRLEEIIKSLKANHKLCITISHDMKFVVNNFGRIIVLCDGEILLDGDKYDVLSKPDILKQSFVSPPPLTRLGQKAGMEETIFAVEDLIDIIKKGNI